MFVLQVPAFMALSVLHFYWCCCSKESLLSRLSSYQSDKNNGCISCLRLDFMRYFIFDLVLQSKIWKEEFSTWATIPTFCWMYSIFEDSRRWPKPNAISRPDTKVWRHHRIWFWTHEVRSKTILWVLARIMLGPVPLSLSSSKRWKMYTFMCDRTEVHRCKSFWECP